jgi:serine/threonine-protein kinase RsbW
MRSQFRFNATSGECKRFRGDLQRLLDTAGFEEPQKTEVVLAVDEVLSNIARHAYEGPGEIEIEFKDHADHTEIVVRDSGKTFDLTQAPLPDLPRTEPGGLGIYLIRTLMDKVEHGPRASGGNELRLTKFKRRKA